jgi:four helix bundle protein
MTSSGFPNPTTPTPVRGYRDLVVWQRAIELVVESYRLSALLPPREFDLLQQWRSAAVSVSLNIAEGHGRLGLGEFIHSLSHARGSLFELETLLYITEAVGFIRPAKLAKAYSLADETSRMLTTMIRKLSLNRQRLQGRRRGSRKPDRSRS